MNNNETPIEVLFQKAEAYGLTAVELLKLKTIDKFAEVVSSLTSQLVISLIASMFVFSINIGISLWIGEKTGKSYYGFFIVAGFYLVIAIIVFVYRHRWIKKPITNTIIKQMLN